MTDLQQYHAFMAAVRSGRLTQHEIAEKAGLTIAQVRDLVVRGRAARRIEIHDEVRTHVWIGEVVA